MSLYLVTGGCGFIGSHLVRALLAENHAVRVLDDLSSGHRRNLPAAVALTVGDVADPATVAAALEGVAGCFHLAAIASVARGMTEWRGTHRVNLSATVGLLDAVRARRGGAVPVVYASSAAVYGDCRTQPIAEAADRAPLSAYGADKYGCELHARVASAVHGIPTVGLRFFNVYGARQDPASPYSGVISIFCDRLRRGEPVAIHGDGGQTRDFVHVGDVVAALTAAMRRPPPGAPVLNVCTGRPTSILQLAHLVAALCGRDAVVNHEPARAGDIRHSLGDPAALAAVLGVRATTALADGLPGVLAWMATEADG